PAGAVPRRHVRTREQADPPFIKAAGSAQRRILLDGSSRVAALTAGAVTLAAVGLVAWARRSRVSVRAKLVNDVALPLSGMKRRARDAQGLRREIARHRRIEPARPTLW